MFWGLILEPGKCYSQEVIKAFHISMATLEIDGRKPTNQNVPVLLKYEDGRVFSLCYLNPIKRVQCALDLNFGVGEKIGFYSGSGNIRVYLTGYTTADLEGDSSEDEGEEDDMIELLTNTEKTPQKRKESPIEKMASKKMKVQTSVNEIEEIRMEDSEKMNTPTTENLKLHEPQIITTVNGSGPEPVEQKMMVAKFVVEEENRPVQTQTSEKSDKKNNWQGTPKPAGKPEENLPVQTPTSVKSYKKNNWQAPPNPANPQKRIIEGGIEIVDLRDGRGTEAMFGRKVGIYYVGKLQHNDMRFDSLGGGEGFTFTLGNEEVIKGLDLGIPGMRPDGRRIITIPAEMAYGVKGYPPIIPPNSNLVFDIVLKSVKM